MTSRVQIAASLGESGNLWMNDLAWRIGWIERLGVSCTDVCVLTMMIHLMQVELETNLNQDHLFERFMSIMIQDREARFGTMAQYLPLTDHCFPPISVSKQVRHSLVVIHQRVRMFIQQLCFSSGGILLHQHRSPHHSQNRAA